MLVTSFFFTHWNNRLLCMFTECTCLKMVMNLTSQRWYQVPVELWISMNSSICLGVLMWETWKTKTDVAISMPFLFVFLSMFTLMQLALLNYLLFKKHLPSPLVMILNQRFAWEWTFPHGHVWLQAKWTRIFPVNQANQDIKKCLLPGS